MRPIGFSTGALARGDFRRALDLLEQHRITVVELSALRIEELEPLAAAIPDLDLTSFSFVSVHAPSRFERSSESWVVRQLVAPAERGYPIVSHPDVIFTADLWAELGDKLLIENMDNRKASGRNVDEMQPVFERLPKARFCFDIGHARQVDAGMTEAGRLLRTFGDRLAEVHISEVNSASRHDPISQDAVGAFQTVEALIPEDVPVVLETLIAEGQSDIPTEMRRARSALGNFSLAAV